MRYVLEHLAVAVCAITGVLAAKGKRLDLFGVIVLALATALGGGTVRDLCLAVKPVFWIQDPNYVLTAVAAALVAFIAARFREMPHKLLLVADAFGLALFTIVGMEKALANQTTGMIAVLLGVVTGVAGGMIRDVLTGEIPLVFRPEIYLYATAALCGAVTLLVLNDWLAGGSWNRLIAMVVILALRLAAIQWKLRLPVFRHRDTDTGNPT